MKKTKITELEKQGRKHAQSEPVLVLKATAHNELYNAPQQPHVRGWPYCSAGVGGTCFSAS